MTINKMKDKEKIKEYISGSFRIFDQLEFWILNEGENLIDIVYFEHELGTNDYTCYTEDFIYFRKENIEDVFTRRVPEIQTEKGEQND